MTVAERTLYVGTLYVLFTLFSSDSGLATLAFLGIVFSGFTLTLLIRDLARIFADQFSDAFYIFLSCCTLFAVITHHGPESWLLIATDGVTPVAAIVPLGFLALFAHGLYQGVWGQKNYWTVEPFDNSESSNSPDSGSGGDGPDDPEDRTDEYVEGDEGDGNEEDAEASTAGSSQEGAAATEAETREQ